MSGAEEAPPDGPEPSPTVVGTLDEVAERLPRASRVLLSCHTGPDGDALGSLSALAVLLRERGREVTLLNPDPAPRSLRFLPHVATLVRRLRGGERFDLTLVVDCGDRKLLGERFPPAEVTGPLLVLDHHAASRPFGDLFVCDPSAASVGVLVARLASRLGWEITRPAAIGIYTSLVADTGSFRYANTNAEALELAAALVRSGVEAWGVAEQLGERVTLAHWKLVSAALATIRLEVDGRVAVMTVDDAMVKGAGATWEDTEGLVNYARAIDGVEVGMFITPARDGRVRLSLRSKGRVDAGALCMSFGGGGHVGAAGCFLGGSIDEARDRILEALAAALGPPPAGADGEK